MSDAGLRVARSTGGQFPVLDRPAQRDRAGSSLWCHLRRVSQPQFTTNDDYPTAGINCTDEDANKMWLTRPPWAVDATPDHPVNLSVVG